MEVYFAPNNNVSPNIHGISSLKARMHWGDKPKKDSHLKVFRTPTYNDFCLIKGQVPATTLTIFLAVCMISLSHEEFCLCCLISGASVSFANVSQCFNKLFGNPSPISKAVTHGLVLFVSPLKFWHISFPSFWSGTSELDARKLSLLLFLELLYQSSDGGLTISTVQFRSYNLDLQGAVVLVMYGKCNQKSAVVQFFCEITLYVAVYFI